jgi:hypothetical protein
MSSYLVVGFNDRWPQCFSKMLCRGWSVLLMIDAVESMAPQNLFLSKPMVRAVRGDTGSQATTISPYLEAFLL